jgi:hypothetical protein
MAAVAKANHLDGGSRPAVDEHREDELGPGPCGGDWQPLFEREANHGGMMAQLADVTMTIRMNESLKGKLARATWNVTHRDPCTAMRAEPQSYAVGGKQVWVAMQCSGEKLDAASANPIDAIDALLEAARSANKKQP